MRIREFKRGDVLAVHLKDDTSTGGVFDGSSRRFLRLLQGQMEAGGTMHVLKSDLLLIPREYIKAVEVTRT